MMMSSPSLEKVMAAVNELMSDVASTYRPGLEGVLAGETAISRISPEIQSLTYRGYDIKDVMTTCLFEEIAYLLLFGELPTQSELDAFNTELVAARSVPKAVIDTLRTYPTDAHPMDTLKAGIATLGLYDDAKNEHSHEANVAKAKRLIAQVSTIAAANFRIQQGLEPVAPAGAELNHAENFLYMAFGKKPSQAFAHVFNTTLIIYAEHSFNASTFSARVTTSTLSDIFSGVVAAIGALKGPLHGGANEQAMLTFLEIGSAENAEQWTYDALAQKKKIMGFGHRAYKSGDPRAIAMKPLRDLLVPEVGDTPWPAIADTLEAIVLKEKGLYPNVDYPIGYIYYMMGIPTQIYTPIFAVGRMAGWTAHVVEQLANNRLIRPKALYTGSPDRAFTPLADR